MITPGNSEDQHRPVTGSGTICTLSPLPPPATEESAEESAPAIRALPGAQGYLDVDVVAAEILESATNRPNQTVTGVLNQAYLSVPLSERLFFNLGKKRIVWVVALAYNPSDFINPAKDPLHPEEERRGVYCAELELIADRMSVNQVVVLFDRLEAFGYGTKLSAYGLIPATDVNVSFYYSNRVRWAGTTCWRPSSSRS